MYTDQWTVLAVAAIIIVAVAYIVIAAVAIKAADFIWGNKVGWRVERVLADKPLEIIEDVFVWPKRSIDRLRFHKAFGFFPVWEYINLIEEQEQAIDATLADAADALHRAFQQENWLQLRRAMVGRLRVELKSAEKRTKQAKKRFWHLHDLARHVAGYPFCDTCSYERHLSQEYVVRRRTS